MHHSSLSAERSIGLKDHQHGVSKAYFWHSSKGVFGPHQVGIAHKHLYDEGLYCMLPESEFGFDKKRDVMLIKNGDAYPVSCPTMDMSSSRRVE
jgi:hypothetical protein